MFLVAENRRLGFCNRHGNGDRTSISVWCSQVGAPACEIKSGHATDCQRCQNHQGGKKQKTAPRIFLSLDNRGPHKCSAGSSPLRLKRVVYARLTRGPVTVACQCY